MDMRGLRAQFRPVAMVTAHNHRDFRWPTTAFWDDRRGTGFARGARDQRGRLTSGTVASSVLSASDKLHSHSDSGLIKVEVLIDHEKKNKMIKLYIII